MDINDYRRKIEKSVAKAQADKAKAAPVMDLEAAPSRRRAPSTKKKQRSPKARAEELGRVTDAQGPDAVPQAALDRLADPKETPAVRLAAIKLLQQQQITSSIAEEWRPAFVEALRTAVGTPSLRAAAVEVLALLKDRWTQEALVEGIRQPKKALVPLHEALRLLSIDVHADAIDVARQVMKTPQMRRNKPAVVHATRILSADPGSLETLETVLGSEAYPMDARRVAATAISHLKPERFQGEPEGLEAPGPRRRRAPGGAAARPKGDLAKHLETLRKVHE
jgi:hypothetical protein